jgi:site-specific DNA-adenine methylase
MFSYYGSKKRLAPLYAPPEFDTLIEPFAGAAGYSLHGDHWERNVMLFDCNPKIVATWKYLISASKKDILSLPDIQPKQTLTEFKSLSTEERYLIGYHLNPASTRPKLTATQRVCWNQQKLWIAANLYKVRHWQVFQQSYADIPNRKATWFVDPPYQKVGKWYNGFQHMDFRHLGGWCRERQGQAIVCENRGARWLPFRLLVTHKGMVQTNTEVVWVSR